MVHIPQQTIKKLPNFYTELGNDIALKYELFTS